MMRQFDGDGRWMTVNDMEELFVALLLLLAMLLRCAGQCSLLTTSIKAIDDVHWFGQFRLDDPTLIFINGPDNNNYF